MRAVRLFEKGLSQSEVGRKLGVPRQTAHRWHFGWRSGGTAALRRAGRAGRMSRLTEQHRTHVEAALKAGARESGFGSDVWTLPRLAILVARLTGIQYHPDHMSRLMRAWGWSCQRPAKRAKERNEEQIERWKRVEWRRIKKKPKKKAGS